MIIPYIQSHKMNESLKLLYKNKKPPSFRNVAPTLTLLGFMDKEGNLTPIGNIYTEALIRNDIEKARSTLSKIIKDIELFDYLIKKLEATGKLTIVEIGNIVKDKYGKKWKTASTKTYGKSCASLISFSGNGYLVGDTLLLEGEAGSIEEYPIPSASYNDIVRSLRGLNRLGTTSNKKLSIETGIHERKLPGILAVADALNLVNRFSRSTHGINENGERLIDPSLTALERKDIFTTIMLESKYLPLIQSFDGKLVTQINLGKKIGHDLKKSWSESTTKDAGKKIWNLLKNTTLLEGSKKKWKLVIKRKEVSEKKSNIIESPKLWKHLGAIEVAITNRDDNTFTENLNKLKEFTIVPKNILDLIEYHYLSFKEAENSDPNIILKDIEFLENEIRKNLGKDKA